MLKIRNVCTLKTINIKGFHKRVFILWTTVYYQQLTCYRRVICCGVYKTMAKTSLCFDRLTIPLRTQVQSTDKKFLIV